MNQYIALLPLVVDKVVGLVEIFADVFVESVFNIEVEVLYVRGEVEGIASNGEYCCDLVCL